MKKCIYCVLCALFLLSACKKGNLKPITSTRLEVINQGVPGNTVPDLLARVKNVTNENPDLVILMIGTNDTKYPGIFNDYQSNLSRLIDLLKKSGARVILLTPPPCLSTSLVYVYHDKLEQVCTIISNLSKKKSCELVDIHSQLDSIISQPNRPMLYNSDGVHPNKDGYVVIANHILTYLKANPIKGGLKIVCFGDSITYGSAVDGQGTSTGDTYPAILARGINHSLQSGFQSDNGK
jgi:lysophospholipase L1-like esterase